MVKDPWNCSFEDDILVSLHKSANNDNTLSETSVRLTLVSEFYMAASHTLEVIHANIRDNCHHDQFIYVIGECRKQLRSLQDILPSDNITMDVYYAQGGVTFCHLFFTASLCPETFLIHNADIAIGNMSKLLEGSGLNHRPFDDAALVGSRIDALRGNAHCEEYYRQGSFDSYLAKRKSMDCIFFNNLRSPPFYWGAKNVVASLLPKKHIANLCPYRKFDHFHPSGDVASSISGLREKRVRVNSDDNSWVGANTRTVFGLIVPSLSAARISYMWASSPSNNTKGSILLNRLVSGTSRSMQIKKCL